MRHPLGGTLRALVIAGLFLLVCFISRASAQNTLSAKDSAFFKEFPLAWVYRGVALYAAEDYDGAISAWQGYLDQAGKDADTAGVNALIREAWIHEYPLSLVYESVGRYQARDIVGAIASLERYIELAPAGEDTAAVRRMIVNVLTPELEMAKVSQKVSWFPSHKLQGILEDLNPPATLAASGGTRSRAAELRMLSRKQSIRVNAYRVMKQS